MVARSDVSVRQEGGCVVQPRRASIDEPDHDGTRLSGVRGEALESLEVVLDEPIGDSQLPKPIFPEGFVEPAARVFEDAGLEEEDARDRGVETLHSTLRAGIASGSMATII